MLNPQEDFLSDRRMAIIFRRVKGVPQAVKASRDSDSLAEKPAEAGGRRRPDAAPCRAMVPRLGFSRFAFRCFNLI